MSKAKKPDSEPGYGPATAISSGLFAASALPSGRSTATSPRRALCRVCGERPALFEDGSGVCRECVPPEQLPPVDDGSKPVSLSQLQTIIRDAEADRNERRAYLLERRLHLSKMLKNVESELEALNQEAPL